jgi:aspartate/tyrosine/aromatic aminotransferase
MMFSALDIASPDAILGLTEAFQRDPNPGKINLSVGVYKDDSGATPILKCVKKAERILLETESTKSYLGIDGLAAYANAVRELLFGARHNIITAQRSCSVQTPGGTSALRVAADFLKGHFPDARVWISRPTWENHPAILESAGLKVEWYSYFAPSTNDLDFLSMMQDLERTEKGDVVLLHGGCHNPSGVDPSPDQWHSIADLVQRRQLLPLVDFAYQGFGAGIDDDALGLRILCDRVDELLIASSFSKNFGLYRERVGALTAVGPDARTAAAVLSHLKRCIRTNYSNPPSHGASVVSTILSDQDLRSEWLVELAGMRDRISGMRTMLVSKMKEHAPNHDFSFVEKQRGMFSFSGLNRDQVNRLRDEHAIYIVGSGRINVAGITHENIDRFCIALAQVLD